MIQPQTRLRSARLRLRLLSSTALTFVIKSFHEEPIQTLQEQTLPPVPETNPRCPRLSTIDYGQCTKYAGHLPPCIFGSKVDSSVSDNAPVEVEVLPRGGQLPASTIEVFDWHGQPLITERPDWLPEGHAFCPGPKEEVRARMYMDAAVGEEQFQMMIYRCEHGEWNDQAAAWTAHAQFAPPPGEKLTTQVSPVFLIERFLDRMEDAMIELREKLKTYE